MSSIQLSFKLLTNPMNFLKFFLGYRYQFIRSLTSSPDTVLSQDDFKDIFRILSLFLHPRFFNFLTISDIFCFSIRDCQVSMFIKLVLSSSLTLVARKKKLFTGKPPSLFWFSNGNNVKKTLFCSQFYSL
jgi:hypothetical protein